MDLPKVFNATFDTIIDNTPYFTIPDDLVTNSSKLLIITPVKNEIEQEKLTSKGKAVKIIKI